MANPYHDETGRFTSRDEMRGAVERLQTAGRIKEALALSLELSDLDYARAKEAEAKPSAFSAGATTSIPRSYRSASTAELEHEWRSGNLKTAADKARFLTAWSLDPKVRDEVIETLDFGDRYEILEQNEYDPEVARAFIAGQENRKLGDLDYDSLVWVAMYSLDRDTASQHAARNPQLADQFRSQYGYLEGRAEFDRQLIRWGHDSGRREVWDEVGKRSADPAVLLQLTTEPGLSVQTLQAIAGNEHLDDAGARAVVARGGLFLNSWREIRGALLKNPGISAALRERWDSPTSQHPSYSWSATRQAEAEAALTSALRAETAAADRVRQWNVDRSIDFDDYYRALEADADATQQVEAARARADIEGGKLYQLHDAQAAKRGTTGEQLGLARRVRSAEAYLIWRVDAALTGEN